MTITEAIKNMQYVVIDSEEIYSTDIHNSLLLGVEALKHLERERLDHCEPYGELLPGETEE